MNSNTDKGCRIYIGGLLDTVTKEDIEEKFKKYGEISDIWIARNPPGFAFVVFKKKSDAEKTIQLLDGTMVFGSQIKVELAKNTGKKKNVRSMSREVKRSARDNDRYFDNKNNAGRVNVDPRFPNYSNKGLTTNNTMIDRNNSNQINIDLLKDILMLVKNANKCGPLNNINNNTNRPPILNDEFTSRYGSSWCNDSSFGRRIRDRSPIGTRDSFDQRNSRDINSSFFYGRNPGRNFNRL